LDEQEEQHLIAQAQAGDMTALRPLFSHYADPLYGAILPRMPSAAAAEDVLRETFLIAIEKIGSFRWQGRGIYGWLRRIALNKVHDAHRRARRTTRALQRLAGEPGEAFEEGAEQALIAKEDRRRAKARVEAALARLPERYRTAIQLRLLEEHPREECARRLGVTVGTFDVVFFRAVRAFRKHDEEEADR
jgi:RNA polymerase sigma factor (sigma-70 family)